jgi:hypothetical protein
MSPDSPSFLSVYRPVRRAKWEEAIRKKREEMGGMDAFNRQVPGSLAQPFTTESPERALSGDCSVVNRIPAA